MAAAREGELWRPLGNTGRHGFRAAACPCVVAEPRARGVLPRPVRRTHGARARPATAGRARRRARVLLIAPSATARPRAFVVGRRMAGAAAAGACSAVQRPIPRSGPCRVAGVRAGATGQPDAHTAARTCVAGDIRTGRFWSDRTCAVRRLDLTAAGTAPAAPAGACLGGSSGRDGMVVVPWCLARTPSSAGCGACQRTVTERLQKVSVSDSLVADDESLSDL